MTEKSNQVEDIWASQHMVYISENPQQLTVDIQTIQPEHLCRVRLFGRVRPFIPGDPEFAHSDAKSPSMSPNIFTPDFTYPKTNAVALKTSSPKPTGGPNPLEAKTKDDQLSAEDAELLKRRQEKIRKSEELRKKEQEKQQLDETRHNEEVKRMHEAKLLAEERRRRGQYTEDEEFAIDHELAPTVCDDPGWPAIKAQCIYTDKMRVSRETLGRDYVEPPRPRVKLNTNELGIFPVVRYTIEELSGLKFPVPPPQPIDSSPPSIFQFDQFFWSSNKTVELPTTSLSFSSSSSSSSSSSRPAARFLSSQSSAAVVSANTVGGNRSVAKPPNGGVDPSGIYADNFAVYMAVVRPLFNKLIAGINCTLITYGHSRTGKTYSLVETKRDKTNRTSLTPLPCFSFCFSHCIFIFNTPQFGDKSDRGLLHYFVDDLFERANSSGYATVHFNCFDISYKVNEVGHAKDRANRRKLEIVARDPNKPGSFSAREMPPYVYSTRDSLLEELERVRTYLENDMSHAHVVYEFSIQRPTDSHQSIAAIFRVVDTRGRQVPFETPPPPPAPAAAKPTGPPTKLSPTPSSPVSSSPLSTAQTTALLQMSETQTAWNTLRENYDRDQKQWVKSLNACEHELQAVEEWVYGMPDFGRAQMHHSDTRATANCKRNLMKILSEPLAGDSLTTVLATFSPSVNHYQFTFADLQFVNRLKRIVTSAQERTLSHYAFAPELAPFNSIDIRYPGDEFQTQQKKRETRTRSILDYLHRTDPELLKLAQQQVELRDKAYKPPVCWLNSMKWDGTSNDDPMPGKLDHFDFKDYAEYAKLAPEQRTAHLRHIPARPLDLAVFNWSIWSKPKFEPCPPPVEYTFFPLYGDESGKIVVGCVKGNRPTVVVARGGIMKRHAVLQCHSDGHWTIRNVRGSPVFLNGVRVVDPMTVNHGDRLMFGVEEYFQFVDGKKPPPVWASADSIGEEWYKFQRSVEIEDAIHTIEYELWKNEEAKWLIAKERPNCRFDETLKLVRAFREKDKADIRATVFDMERMLSAVNHWGRLYGHRYVYFATVRGYLLTINPDHKPHFSLHVIWSAAMRGASGGDYLSSIQLFVLKVDTATSRIREMRPDQLALMFGKTSQVDPYKPWKKQIRAEWDLFARETAGSFLGSGYLDATPLSHMADMVNRKIHIRNRVGQVSAALKVAIMVTPVPGEALEPGDKLEYVPDYRKSIGKKRAFSVRVDRLTGEALAREGVAHDKYPFNPGFSFLFGFETHSSQPNHIDADDTKFIIHSGPINQLVIDNCRTHLMEFDVFGSSAMMLDEDRGVAIDYTCANCSKRPKSWDKADDKEVRKCGFIFCVHCDLLLCGDCDRLKHYRESLSSPTITTTATATTTTTAPTTTTTATPATPATPATAAAIAIATVTATATAAASAADKTGKEIKEEEKAEAEAEAEPEPEPEPEPASFNNGLVFRAPPRLGWDFHLRYFLDMTRIHYWDKEIYLKQELNYRKTTQKGFLSGAIQGGLAPTGGQSIGKNSGLDYESDDEEETRLHVVQDDFIRNNPNVEEERHKKALSYREVLRAHPPGDLFDELTLAIKENTQNLGEQERRILQYISLQPLNDDSVSSQGTALQRQVHSHLTVRVAEICQICRIPDKTHVPVLMCMDCMDWLCTTCFRIFHQSTSIRSNHTVKLTRPRQVDHDRQRYEEVERDEYRNWLKSRNSRRARLAKIPPEQWSVEDKVDQPPPRRVNLFFQFPEQCVICAVRNDLIVWCETCRRSYCQACDSDVHLIRPLRDHFKILSSNIVHSDGIEATVTNSDGRPVPVNVIHPGLLGSEEAGEKLGSGAGGRVWKGLFNSTEVAVKVPLWEEGYQVGQEEAEKQRKAFEMEVVINATIGAHPKVVGFMGAWLHPPYHIVLHYMPKGSLDKYMNLQNVAGPCSVIEYGISWMERVTRLYKMTKFMHDACTAIIHLHSLRLIHRDIAARNFLTDGEAVKVCDFGLTKILPLGKLDGTADGSERLPLIWCAPEALNGFHYSSATDVFMFAMLLVEVINRGDPYQELKGDHNLNQYISQLSIFFHNRPYVTGFCPKVWWKIIQQAWHPNPASRMTLEHIAMELSDFLIRLSKIVHVGDRTKDINDEDLIKIYEPKCLELVKWRLNNPDTQRTPDHFREREYDYAEAHVAAEELKAGPRSAQRRAEDDIEAQAQEYIKSYINANAVLKPTPLSPTSPTSPGGMLTDSGNSTTSTVSSASSITSPMNDSKGKEPYEAWEVDEPEPENMLNMTRRVDTSEGGAGKGSSSGAMVFTPEEPKAKMKIEASGVSYGAYTLVSEMSADEELFYSMSLHDVDNMIEHTCPPAAEMLVREIHWMSDNVWSHTGYNEVSPFLLTKKAAPVKLTDKPTVLPPDSRAVKPTVKPTDKPTVLLPDSRAEEIQRHGYDDLEKS